MMVGKKIKSLKTATQTSWDYLMMNPIYPKELCRRKSLPSIDSMDSLTTILRIWCENLALGDGYVKVSSMDKQLQTQRMYSCWQKLYLEKLDNK